VSKLKSPMVSILNCLSFNSGRRLSTNIFFKSFCLRNYESLLDLAFLKVNPAKFYQVSDYRLSRASSLKVYFVYAKSNKDSYFLVTLDTICLPLNVCSINSENLKFLFCK
jgi:hypothetical protein